MLDGAVRVDESQLREHTSSHGILMDVLANAEKELSKDISTTTAGGLLRPEAEESIVWRITLRRHRNMKHRCELQNRRNGKSFKEDSR
jgi:hypothetical protein